MFDEAKTKLEALKVTMDFQRRDNDSLNNILNDIKVAYNIADNDWLKISVAFSVLTSREVIGKMGGGRVR